MAYRDFRRSKLALLAGAAVLTGVGTASGGEKWTFGPDSWLSVGAGLRASYTYNEDALDEHDARLESARIYTNGQFSKVIGFTFNTEIEVDGRGDINDLRMMDAILRLEFNDYFNIWGGRMLAPSDRSNLNGPYYIGTWEYPLIASRYPQIFQGRDNGAAIWGETGKGVFKYAVGAFAGCTEEDNACDNPDTDSPLIAGRLTYNFWDPESGYYTSSDYYGEKELLSVALVGQFQADAATDGITSGDFSGFNIDVLMQKKVFGGHVLTLEGAYYVFDTDGIDAINGLSDGRSLMFLTSFLIDHKVGIGKFQPVFRYQDFENDFGPDVSEWSIGTNYIIKGHDLRLSAIYSETDIDDSSDNIERFIAGVQLQW
ncbi:porin [Hyphomicrobium sp. CS1GBMeth3]|uniref:porin n=1 Tax=Hyphomicrobium sp. CS1GBMeth3 TaxID=1892845 RepID=UPI0009310521|nr:porin [Hyphomicrobium sp. CS1GBMeth3]